MDTERALEHARAVGQEIVRLGLGDPDSLNRLFRAYAAYLKQGVEGTFIQLLVARRAIDLEVGKKLQKQFPSPLPAQVPEKASADDSTAEADALLLRLNQLSQQPPELLESNPTARFTGSQLAAVLDPISKAPRVTDEEEEGVLSWLECEPLAPFPLGLQPVVTIGRDKGCDVVLPHQGVSRTHAVIRLIGDELIFEDRSTYGTFVNGEKARTKALEPGDLFAIGPYILIVRDTNPGIEKADTAPFRIPGFATEAMHGKLRDVSLPEVLQQIEFNRKAGTLRIRSGDLRGVLVVHEGQPAYAELGEVRDEQAVFQMLDLNEGEFSFVRSIEPGERTMHGTITGLLLKASRRKDEGG